MSRRTSTGLSNIVQGRSIYSKFENVYASRNDRENFETKFLLATFSTGNFRPCYRDGNCS